MTRGTILLVLMLLLTSSAVPAPLAPRLAVAMTVPGAAAQTPLPPNIVFILADDLDLNLDTVTTMPHLQALLAGQGITFTHFFVNASICCPSRASLLRGQYVHNHGVYTNGPPPDGGFEAFRDLGLENDTIATRLQTAGYRTGLFGKYLNRYAYGSPPTYIPPGWDEWYSPSPTGPGYNQYNYTLNENGTLVAYGSAPEDYLQDVLTTRAVSFITNTVAMTQPFFLYFSSFSPHTPSTPAPRHTGLFTDTLAPRPPSFNEADISDKPQWMQSLPLLTPAEIEQIDAQYRLWLQSMQAVDETITALADTLETSGQLNNTYFFFTSDNGYHMGQHRLLPGKYLGYEEDIRAPLFVRGPHVPISQTTPYLAGIVDLAPTLADIAGLEIPGYMDGRSLLPLLHDDPPADWRQAFLFEQYVGDHVFLHDPLGEPPDPFDSPRFRSAPLFYAGLRLENLKIIAYDSGERELYDLANDPYELENQAANANPTTLAQLSAWLSLLRDCAGETCRALEMQMPPPPPTCAELDFDASGSLTIMDVAQVTAHWGETPQTPGWNPVYDLDDNLTIDAADIAIIAARWGEICAPP